MLQTGRSRVGFPMRLLDFVSLPNHSSTRNRLEPEIFYWSQFDICDCCYCCLVTSVIIIVSSSSNIHAKVLYEGNNCEILFKG
jgi:hypothetical protein